MAYATEGSDPRHPWTRDRAKLDAALADLARVTAERDRLRETLAAFRQAVPRCEWREPGRDPHLQCARPGTRRPDDGSVTITRVRCDEHGHGTYWVDLPWASAARREVRS